MRHEDGIMRAVGDRPKEFGRVTTPERLESILAHASDEVKELVTGLMGRQKELEREVARQAFLQEELKRSRDQYAFLYDFAPVGYFTLDRNGAIRTANRTGALLLGIESVLLLARRFELFVAGEDRPTFGAFLTQVFASRGKETCRLRLEKDGNGPCYVRIDAIATDSGDWCHIVLLDITERRHAELALRDSEYHLAKAQMMTHVGSWRTNPLTGELDVSDELLRIVGLKREEVSPDVITSIIHPEDIPAVIQHLHEGAEQGSNYEIEHRLLLKDGSSKWVYTIVEPTLDASGRVFLYGTTQDVTERKQVEVEVRSQKNELQAIFDSVNDGVVVFDRHGTIQNLNHVSLRLFPQGVEPGKSCRDIFHAEIPVSPEHCPVERALRGERVEFSLGSVRDGEKIRYLDITATPIEDPLGVGNRALVVFRDVTQKRLQELQLIHAEKMSSIGVLATGVAHEINNPLTSVAGYAEALLRRFRDEPALEGDSRLEVFPKYLNVIVRESYHCKNIIDSLLNFGRKSDGFVSSVDLNAIILEILELLRHLSTDADIKVVTNLNQWMPPLHGDPSGLRQVFMNLLINAHQAISGGGTVEVTTSISVPDQMALVEIRDTGCGIAPDVIDRIWDPFFTTKPTGKGLGLGLALTYSIVKRHGGAISLDSKVGEGTRFTIRLPVDGPPSGAGDAAL